MQQSSPRRSGAALLTQLIFAAAVLGLLALIYYITRTNLERLGVQSGFAFLDKQAGFSVAQSLIPYDETSSIARVFCVALLNTVLLAVVAIAASSLIGLAVGAARLSRNWLLARLGTCYVETFRNIPVLLQIFFWYYVVLRQLPAVGASWHLPGGMVLNNRGLYFPSIDVQRPALLSIVLCIAVFAAWLTSRKLAGSTWRIWIAGAAGLVPLIAGVGLGLTGLSCTPPVRGPFEYTGGGSLMPEFIALALGLSMYNASYIAEIVRSGFGSVSRGQTEAAAALGLPSAFTFWRVTLPQALQTIVPPLATVYANIFKSTSLAAAIAYPEIVSVFVGTVNNLVGQPVEIMSVTLVTYALVSFGIAGLMNAYNRRLQRRGTR